MTFCVFLFDFSFYRKVSQNVSSDSMLHILDQAKHAPRSVGS